jgi:alpha-beta hydrolase superfamily lysophospholipase
MTPTGAVRSVVLVVHGLNLDPTKMDELSGSLVAGGAAVLRATLTGHGSDRQAARTRLAEVSRETWREDCRRYLALAAEEARRYGAPLRVLGFSLGSLAVLDALSTHDGYVVDGMVHLAPAIAPRRVAVLARLLPRRLTLPSQTPQAFRVHDRLPASVYHTVLDSAGDLDASQFRDTRALVFIDPRDELVSRRRLTRLIERNGLDEWDVREVHAGHDGLPHHLLVTNRAFAEGEFAALTREIVGFLVAGRR